MAKEEHDEIFDNYKSLEKRKEEVRKLELKYKRELRDFAINYVALWNSCQSLGLNDRQTKGMIELLLNNQNNEEGKWVVL